MVVGKMVVGGVGLLGRSNWVDNVLGYAKLRGAFPKERLNDVKSEELKHDHLLHVFLV